MQRLVMIVDDDENLANTLAVAIEMLPGVKTVLVRHPEAALRSFTNEGPFAGLVTDLGLPCFDGFQLIGKLRRLPRYGALPVLMLTAEDEADVAGADPLSKPDMTLRKPFSPKEVSRALGSLLSL